MLELFNYMESGEEQLSEEQQVFLGEDLMTSGREYSDDTAKLLDEEMLRIQKKLCPRQIKTVA